MATARTICAHVGCGNTKPCSVHPPRKPWAGRGSRHARGYGRCEDGETWDSKRKRILERDNHTCYLCGKHATTVDHEVPKYLGGTNDDRNLRACCRDCQKTKAAREGNAARRAARLRGPRP